MQTLRDHCAEYRGGGALTFVQNTRGGGGGGGGGGGVCFY